MTSPIFDLDFVSGEALDPRLSFSRASTGRYFDRQGVMRTATAGQPRGDHDPLTGRPLGLLVEEARSNLLKYSETFAVPWLNSFGGFTGARNTAPDGQISMVWFEEYTGVGSRYFYQDVTLVAGATYTASIFVRIGTRFRFTLSLQTASGITQASFNLQALTTTTAAGGGGSVAGATITHVGGGIYRCAVTGIAHPTETAGKVQVNMLADDGTLIYSGTEYNGIWLWGAMLEAGAWASSYIPTTSAAVTRAADVASMPLAQVKGWDETQGTILVDAAGLQYASDAFLAVATDGTTNNTVGIYVNGTNAVGEVRSGGIGQAAILAPHGSAASILAGLAWAANDAASALSGGTPGTDTTVTLPSGLTTLHLGSRNGSFFANGRIRRVTLYGRRLTNQMLRKLTA